MKKSALFMVSFLVMNLSGGFVMAETAMQKAEKRQIAPQKMHRGQKLKGRIVGNKLMLIDESGKQRAAPDGIYTIRDGAKIKVEKGKIIDIPSIMMKGSTFDIIDIPM